MELENSFSVQVPIERAWEMLTDVAMIARCLPGAEVQDIDGADYKGTVEVEIGSIVAQYRGTARFVETDEQAGRIVLRAEGSETGQGTADATITASLTPEGDHTLVVVHTDLSITGEVAELGRGAMAEVSAKLMEQFSDNLTSTVLGDAQASEEVSTTATTEPQESAPQESAAQDSAPQASSSPGAGSPDAARASRKTASSTGTQTSGPTGGAEPHVPGTPGEPEPIDLLGVAGGPTARRVVPAVVAVVLALLLIRVLLRRRRPE